MSFGAGSEQIAGFRAKAILHTTSYFMPRHESAVTPLTSRSYSGTDGDHIC